MKIRVSLIKKDWLDLVNFITGDLHNMEESFIKKQLRRIQNEIQKQIAHSEVFLKTNCDGNNHTRHGEEGRPYPKQ